MPSLLLANWLETKLGLSDETQAKLLATFLTLLALWILRLALLRFVRRTSESLTRQYYWRRASLNLLVVVGLLMVGRIWFSSFESLATIVGLASAGFAIALKDPITDLAGWLFLAWRKPFSLGDRIEISTHRGDVVDMRALQFSLMEVGNRVGGDARTGRVIHVPNGMIFAHPIANTTDGWFSDVFLEIKVIITFESDWEVARDILLTISREHGGARAEAMRSEVSKHAPSFLIMQEDLDPEVLVHVVENGVNLVMRMLCPPGKLRRTESKIWQQVLAAFAAHPNIDFAYPTTRFFDNPSENKQSKETPPAKPYIPKAPPTGPHQSLTSLGRKS